jgi:hypothetical protein
MHRFLVWNRRVASITGALSLAAAGCVGTIEGDTENRGGSSASGPDGTGVSTAACTAGIEAPLRRLSRTEYLATVADLFPGIDLTKINIAADPSDKGFENRANLLNPEPLVVEDYSSAAADIAAAAMANPASVLPFTPASPSASDEAACATTFVQTFGRRAFRRPLTSDEETTYTSFLNGELASALGFNGAVQLTVEAMLEAPQFIYRLELGAPDWNTPHQLRLTPFEVATRMSYLLWGSEPDALLMTKAENGHLDAPSDRETEARRMLSDPRAKRMFIDFHRQWLDFDQMALEPKDPTTYPTYTPELQAAVREEVNRFVGRVMWSGDGTVRALLTSTATEVNAPLAKLYGVPAPATGWAAVTLNPAERAGILTRADFLAGRAHKLEGTPPTRANYIVNRFLCQTVPPAPANANLSEPTQSADRGIETNRQLFEDRLSPTSCHGCHSSFTDLGYAFETYDAIGAYRTKDHGLPVDVTGHYQSGTIDWQLNGGVDVSQKLADAPQVSACVLRYWYEFAVGRAADDSDTCRLQRLGDVLTAAHGDVREVLVAIVKSPEFVVRPDN